MAITARQVVDALLETARWDEAPPPKFKSGNEDEDTQFAARTPFTAFTQALDVGHHDPRLWRAIKGSPYEREYRRKFNPID